MHGRESQKAPNSPPASFPQIHKNRKKNKHPNRPSGQLHNLRVSKPPPSHTS